MVSHWSLSHSKSPQISRSLLSISPDLSNALIWMVPTYPLISKSFCSFTNPLGNIPSAPATIGITIIFMFHSFFRSLARSRYLSLFSPSFDLTQCSARTAKSTVQQVLFFLLTITKSGRLAESRWSICISKYQRGLCISFSRTDSRLCIYHLFIWSSNFLHSS